METRTRATLLFFYLATQPFTWIKHTASERIEWLISHDYLEEVTTRFGKSRLRLSEKGRAYSYGELGR